MEKSDICKDIEKRKIGNGNRGFHGEGESVSIFRPIGLFYLHLLKNNKGITN